jgi:hypothetical protein
VLFVGVVVGQEGLVDGGDGACCCGVVGRVLVYCACGGVEICGCKCPFQTQSLRTSSNIVGQLFIGVMSSLYSVWDICDDLILRKVNSSDASVFAKRYGGSSQCWGVIWSIISLFFMIGGILAGIAAFPETAAQQKTDSGKFIPTR